MTPTTPEALDGDLIRRGSVLERLELAEHDAEERNEIARLRKYVEAIPAVQSAPVAGGARLEDDVMHSDDVAVNKFAAHMKAKLALSRGKGRSGWDDPEQCSVEYLAEILIEHLVKGNDGTFVDIANFAMMLDLRGADPRILSAVNVRPVAQVQAEAVAGAYLEAQIAALTEHVEAVQAARDMLGNKWSAAEARIRAAGAKVGRAIAAFDRCDAMLDDANEFTAAAWLDLLNAVTDLREIGGAA